MENKIKRFLSLVLAIVMVAGMMPATVLAANSAESIQSDLIAWYDFNGVDGTTVTDETGNGNNATLINDAAVIEDTRGSGYVMSLDGGRASNAPGLRLPAAMFRDVEDVTIIMDVKLDSTSRWMCLLNAGVSGQQQKYMTFVNEGYDDNTKDENGNTIGQIGLSNATSQNGGDDDEKRIYASYTDKLPTDGSWGRIALRHVQSTGAAQIYLNNRLVADGILDVTLQQLVTDEDCEVRIGSNNVWNDPGLDGLVDNIRIYKRALSEEEMGIIPFNAIDTEEELIEAVAKGGTVELGGDIVLTQKITVTTDTTITGAYTITRDDAYTGTLFTVNTGATLTLDGGLTIDGGNEWSYIKTTPELDMANGNGTKVADHIAPAEGGVNATAHLIVNNGALNLNNVTIENSYSTNGVSVIDAGANSVTTINGATIQKVAANRSGAIAYIGGADAVLTIKGDTRITDNFGTGNGGIIQNYGQGTTVNMEGGKIDKNHVGSSGTLYASYSSNSEKINTFDMSGGIITENKMEGYGPIYIHTNTVWNMTGGEISKNTSYLPNYVRNANPAGIMSGGKIVNNELTCGDYSNGYYVTRPDLRLNGKTEITGGSFTQDVFEYLAPNYGLAYDLETGVHTVTTDIAEVNGTIYHSIHEAAAVAKDGDTVKVLVNHKVNKTTVIETDVTLDFNGKTMLTNAEIKNAPVIRVLADVTVTGAGKIDGRPGESCYAFIVGNSTTPGNLTTESGTFCGDTSSVSVTKGKLTVNGGNFAVNPYVVEGEEDNYNFVLNCIDANYKDGSAVIEVKGGVFYKFDPANNAAEGEGTSFVSAPYFSEEYKTDYWKVSRVYNYVAEVNGTKYETLKEAVAAANELGTATVTMLADVTLGEKLTITGDVTIEGAYTITRDDAYTGTLFEVPADATLTLDGNLTIDGGNKWMLSEQYKTDLERDAIGTAWADYVTPEEGAPSATAPMIKVSGSLNAKNVTIQNHLSTGSSNGGAYSVIQLNSNATLLTEGAKFNHNTTSGANAVAYVGSGATWTINDGTVISDNFAGKNGGISRIDNGTVVMNGGLIENNHSYNTNGTVFMFYGANALFDMNGGTICDNSGVAGGQNGYNAAVYIHSGAKLDMSAGTICHNIGRTCGGIDAPFTSEAEEPGNSSTVSISGGNVWYNSSARYGDHTNLLRFADRASITGGWYSSDPTEWVADGYSVVVHEGMGENGVTLYEVSTAVAYNVENDVYYADLSDALDVADSGETVQLLKTWYEDLVLVPAGVTFDLNGNVVETKNTLSFGIVMDSQTEVGGIKIPFKTSEAFTKLQPENGGYLPVYDDRDGVGMYKFFEYTVKSELVKGGSNQVLFAARVLFTNNAAYEVLANSGDSGIDFVMDMDWTGVSSFDVRYTMSNDNLKSYAAAAYELLTAGKENTKAMTLTVKGVNKLGSSAFIKAIPTVMTVAEVTAYSDVMPYTVP